MPGTGETVRWTAASLMIGSGVGYFSVYPETVLSAPPLFFLIVAYILAISVATFLVFAWDKHCARNGLWRISEQTLLTLATIGGSPGALIGQRVLRHKSWKEPFRTQLRWIVIFQIIVVVALSIPQVRSAAMSFLIGAAV